MADLLVLLLGPFQTIVQSQEATGFQSNKVRALLAFLAAEPDRPHPRETLAGLLWPDYPNPAALTYLRNALSNLRHVIGDAQALPAFLLISRDTINLNSSSSVRIDLGELEGFTTGPINDLQSQIASLQSAIALYRGPFLDGLSCNSPSFEDWASTWRNRLDHRLRETLNRLATAYAKTGEYIESVQTARRLLELGPLDEAAHRLVMQGLAHSGRRSEALTQYESCRHILRQELNIEPSDETQELVETIRNAGLSADIESNSLSDRTGLITRSHLPVPLTSFIGRQSELAEILRRLDHQAVKMNPVEVKARILTLTGSGGCGKTRLALAAALHLADTDSYPDGIWWVDLSSISDPGINLTMIAGVFGLKESNKIPLLQLLLNFIGDKKLLLVVDNCEHLIESIALLIENLLMECRGIQILVTSREPLRIAGENIWRVPSMSFPETDVDSSYKVDQIRKYDAVCLFEERAHAAVTDWKLEENIAGVIQICTRLDGIPLAIELAAAKLRLMSVDQIAARLDDTFHLLTGGNRTALARHQTLRACIDWSYNLLSSAESALLRQLSVFSGGWTLDAVEFIGKTEPIFTFPSEVILDIFTHLVDRSLVMGQRKGQEMRFRLLENIRLYAHEKLVEMGEEQAACNRHMAYFLDLAIRAEEQLRGPRQVLWHEIVKAELDNLNVALSWALRTNPQIELRITSALFWFWRSGGGSWHYDALQWLEWGLTADVLLSGQAYLRNPDRALVRSWALVVAAWFQLSLLNHEYGWTRYRSEEDRKATRARGNLYLEEALTLSQNLGKPGRRALAFALALKTWMNPQQGKEQLNQSFAILQEEGDKFYMAECLIFLGWAALDARNFDQAKLYYQQHVDLREEISDIEGLGFAHLLYGEYEIIQNHFSDAKVHLQEALKDYQSTGICKDYVFRSSQLLAAVAIGQSDFEGALEYSSLMLAISRETGEDWQYALGLLTKGEVLMHSDFTQAALLLNEATTLFIFSGSKSGMVISLDRQANLAFAMAKFRRAARLLSSSVHHWVTEKHVFENYELSRQENLRSAIQTALGEQVFARAWAEGESMTLEQAVAYALEEMN